MRSAILDAQLRELNVNLFEPFKGKTVLVTGATGLVGSLVCKALLLANEQFGICCNVLAAVRSRKKANGIFRDYDYLSGLEVVEFDLINGSLEVKKVDYILHAAAITKSKAMVEHPVDVITTSVMGTLAMLDLTQVHEARMVYISSMEMYGSMEEDEVADENSLGWIDLSVPRSCYPESKRACECLCNAYASQFGTCVCSARLAQTFGAGVLNGENRAFMQFARAAICGDDVVLKTKGLSEGNYVDSIDCVSALLTLLAYGEPGQAYNVVNEESHGTIREVAQTAIDVLGCGQSEVVVEFDEQNRAGYAPDVHLRLSSAKLRSLGWRPTASLDESFERLGQYMKEQLMLRGGVYDD